MATDTQVPIESRAQIQVAEVKSAGCLFVRAEGHLDLSLRLEGLKQDGPE